MGLIILSKGGELLMNLLMPTLVPYTEKWVRKLAQIKHIQVEQVAQIAAYRLAEAKIIDSACLIYQIMYNRLMKCSRK